MNVRPLFAALALLLATLGLMLAKANPASSATPHPEEVTYCETNAVVVDGWERYVTYVELANDDEFVAWNLRMKTLPFEGRRFLNESRVTKGSRIMDCRIREVNGQRSAVLTTVGGAEWRVESPSVMSP